VEKGDSQLVAPRKPGNPLEGWCRGREIIKGGNLGNQEGSETVTSYRFQAEERTGTGFKKHLMYEVTRKRKLRERRWGKANRKFEGQSSTKKGLLDTKTFLVCAVHNGGVTERTRLRLERS